MTLDAYCLSSYEMTQGQWQRFAGSNPSNCGPGTEFGDQATTLLHPVEQVSWEDCVETIDRLGLLLPTEAHTNYFALQSSRRMLERHRNQTDGVTPRTGGRL